MGYSPYYCVNCGIEEDNGWYKNGVLNLCNECYELIKNSLGAEDMCICISCGGSCKHCDSLLMCSDPIIEKCKTNKEYFNTLQPWINNLDVKIPYQVNKYYTFIVCYQCMDNVKK